MAKKDTTLEDLLARVEADPGDGDALKRLAERYQLDRDAPQAAEYYGRLADLLAEQGFAIRAVPLYKQALKLDGSRLDLNLNLAQQYQQMGLKADSVAQMQLVCDSYHANGQHEAELELLSHMLLLDPDNVALRVRRAELCLEVDQPAEGVAELGRAAAYLKRNSRIEEYVKIGERLLFLDPQNLALGRELAQIYLATGETRSALAKLQVCFNLDGQDVETLTLLAQAFRELGQAPKAVKIYKELARIYSENDQADDEQAAWAQVRALDPGDADLPRRGARH
jgi:pilus assembly protein FimV